MSGTAYVHLLDHWRDLGRTIKEDRPGRHAWLQCPLPGHPHGDQKPSLSVTAIEGGIMLWCHCTPTDIYKPIAEWLGWHAGTLLHDHPSGKMVYYYGDGRKVDRWYDKQGTKQFSQRGNTNGQRSVLWHLERIEEARAKGEPIFLVPSEKDVLALEAISAYATCAPQGEGNFDKVDPTPLHGMQVIAVVHNDAKGETKWAPSVLARLDGKAQSLDFAKGKVDVEKSDVADHIAAGYSLAELVPWVVPPAAGKDASDHLDASHGDEDDNDSRVLYVDVGALLSGELPPPKKPELLKRVDGHCLIYRGKTNLLYGPPESGKTWVAIAAGVEELNAGGSVLHIDTDHNGAEEIVGRYLSLGAPRYFLSDPGRFRFAEPEDRAHIDDLVSDAAVWRPDVATIDSVGELVPMFRGDSNSPDDYTRVNRLVMTKLANAGAAVIVVDHTNKDPLTKAPTGTVAKLRVVSGVALKVEVIEAFVPGVGGKAALVVYKDRPGGVRKHCPRDSLSPTAGIFTMWCARGNAELLMVKVYGPRADSREDEAKSAKVMMLTALKALDPPPSSVRDVKNRMGWGTSKASEAMQLWREHEQQERERSARSGNVPGTPGTEALFDE